MPDREKVINGLEQFIADFKPFCGNKADWQRVYDAIALLKAQDKDAEIIRKCRDGEVMKHVGNGVKGLNRVRRKTRQPIERIKLDGERRDSE